LEFRQIDEMALIKAEDSSDRRKFLSLLNANYQSGLLQEQEFLEYQTEIASILTDLIRLYTSGDSSSVKEETAAQILGSIYYALDAYTARMDDSSELLHVLRENGAHQIYNEGVKMIRTCLDETKKKFKRIAENKLNIPLMPYNDMLDSAIPEYLSTYDVEFNAQDTSCSMDYPLIFDNMSIRGIFYIRQYLEILQIETEFCRLLNQSEVLRTLYRYGVKFDMDIINVPVNLFEILFDQLVFTVLSGNEKMDLAITPLQCQQMADNLSRMDRPKVEERIHASVNKIVTAFRIENPGLLTYLHRYRQQFAGRVVSANGHGNIMNIVLVEGENVHANKNIFTDGDRMNNLRFSRITELVAECDRTEKKIKLISDNVHSAKDFIDLLEADCLYGDEFRALYDSLGDTELAVLGRVIFSDELHQNRLHFTPSLFDRYERSSETDWKKCFVNFLLSIKETRRSHIEQSINNLVIQDDILY